MDMIKSFVQEKTKRRKWHTVLALLACVVAFCTTYTLILPAITMTADTFCGVEEHTHDDACWELTLICDQGGAEASVEATDAHVHTEACYEVQQVLSCSTEESAGHAHGAECYALQSALSCGQDKSEEHKHMAECYTETEILVCGTEEAEGHVHTDECYTEQSVLICTETAEPVDETPVHEHTDACYEKVLICEEEEHTHSLPCYSDPDADIEGAASWVQSGLTGVWADDVVTVAGRQVGYTESTKNYIVTEDGQVKGITRYGQWYGDPYGDWCAMFVSFCLNYAGVPQSAIPYASGCAYWVSQLQSAGLYKRAAECVPQPGSLVFFDTDGDGLADHVGIVTAVSEDGSCISTIEGNVGDAVAVCSHAAASGSTMGYCILPGNQSSVSQDAETPTALPTEDITADNETLPDDSIDTSSEILPDDAADTSNEAPQDDTIDTSSEVQSDDTVEATSEALPADPAEAASDAATADAALTSPIMTASENDIQTTDADDTTESIAVGETKTVSVGAGETVKLSFTPEYTHEYVFYSSASGDTYGYLYDANGKQLTFNDDGGGSAQFKITYKLTAGETYYWGARWYNSSKTGDIPVYLEFGTHTYSENEQGDFICTSCGTSAPTSGSCGDNLTWSFDKETGTLFITGTGDMTKFSNSDKTPWAHLASKIKNVSIGEGATSVSSYAFQNCSSLENVSLPNTLSNVGKYAFCDCTALTNIDLSGTGVTSIGSNAFQRCSSLETVSLPSTLSNIDSYAFESCTALDSIDLSHTGVTSIAASVFRNCTSLKAVSFPGTLTSINSYAFCGCSVLTDVDLSGTVVTSISNNAFSDCSSLKNVLSPDTLTSLGASAFYNCKALENIDLSGTGLTSIDSCVFQSCTALKTVSFPNGLTRIGTYAFSNCRSLEMVDLSQTAVTDIGNNAFASCSALKEVLLPNTLSALGSYAFSSCSSLPSVDLSATAVTVITESAFQNCSALRTVHLPERITSIGKTAFYNCKSLSEFVIQETVTSVGANAFQGCSSLAELRLEAPDAVFDPTQSSTGSSLHVTVAATVNNVSVAAVTALDNMGCTSISFEGPNYFTAGGWQADFLPERLVDLPQSEYFVDAQGVVYRVDGAANTASVFYCPPGLESYTVLKELPTLDEKEAPIPVTGVDSLAFSNAADLTALTFEAPETITTLSDMAFYHAVNLETINGQSTSQDVLNTFTADDRETGTMLFYQTKITDTGEQITPDPIVEEKDDLKVTISTEAGTNLKPAQSDDGTYRYYTGESAKTTITVSNPDSSADTSGTVVRVYFRFDDKGGNISYAPGTYTVKSGAGNSYTMKVVKTPETGCYYVELERPQKGDTISILVESSYPSPSSDGGNAAVWGAVLTEEDIASIGTGLVPAETYHRLNWSTVPDTFPVTKTEKSTGSSQLKGDGEGGAYISDLSYTIQQSRSGTTLEGVGKDYMTSVDFEDVLTLPDGASLAEDVLKSIQDGTVTAEVISYTGLVFKTAEGRRFLRITTSNPSTNWKYLRNGSISVNEDGNLVIRWSFVNADLSTEIDDIIFFCYVEDSTLMVPDPEADKVYVVDNAVTATQHFMYSKDQMQQDDCSAQVKVADSSLTLSKVGVRNGFYFGEASIYSITATNPGALPYEKLAFLADDLPSGFYMRPADLAAAFAEDTEHQLTVTIVNVTLCTTDSGKTVSGIDASTAVTNGQNSGSNTRYNGMSNTDPDTGGYQASTITISWGSDGQLQIAVKDGGTYSCAAEEGAIKSVLESIGLVVTPKTQYCLKWDLRNADGTIPPLVGGGQVQKLVYCAAKDSFMRLNNDTLNQYGSSYYSEHNYGEAIGADNRTLKTVAYYITFNREFSLGKNWSMNGEAIEHETKIQEGNILDYTLSISHKGDGQYDALPLTDHMSGTQALLVPTAKNSGADWAQGLQTVTDNGTEYYVLSTPGTYRNVWTSEDQLADSVEVTKTTSGFDTLIKWYFTNYTGMRSDTVAYRSYVCTDGELAYSLDNESWLSDHESHRLYANLPGWTGTAFDFDKEIVDAVGDTGAGSDYSLVSEGETVVYRLMLTSPTDVDGNVLPMTITGKDMYDALPLSIDGCRWSSENVRITYADDYTVTNGGSWSIAEPEAGDQQYIRWADEFSLTFTGTAYIYVELDFPSDIRWQEYATKYGTTELKNSFYVLSVERSVTHEVSIPAQVYLQKGVYSTGYIYKDYARDYYKTDISTQDGRLYYQNDDVKIRAVQYYVALYNAGPTNLYLTDMQDLLPSGFTCFTTSTYTSTGSSGPKITKSDGSAAAKKMATVGISTKTDENGRQIVTFHFSEYAASSVCISYDEERGMCYLKPGETVTFTYVCKTNSKADTDDSALNTVTMPYYDFNGGGVVVDDSCTITPSDSYKYTPNDGGCDVLGNGQAENMGFIGGTNDTQWLMSQVTQVRGDIKPGITKALTSKTDRNGTTTQNPVSAAPTDTLNWSITAENDGTDSISDYVLTDRMQSPYMFTGNVSYTIYRSSDSSSLVAKPTSSNYLFTIAKGSDDEHLMVTTDSGTSQTLTIGGDPITLCCYWQYSKNSATSDGDRYYKYVDYQLSIARDADGNAVMSLYFPDATMAIPEGGQSILTLSTDNPTNTLENKQYINTCFITPMSQTWDNTTNKGNVTTLETPYGEGELPSVRNSAPVTTSYGYVTSSVKRITEVGNETNTASCADETNYIVLADETKQFTYTLTVNNSTPKAMDKFVLIDGLPEIGDHTVFLASDPRFSEFKVSLAEEPEFAVTVTDENENVTTLDPDSYTIAYSTATEFTSDDWKGTSTWSESAEGARSIRLIINDSEGTLIPAGSTVSLSFVCKIDDPNVQPGQIAWNSFGYHYSLHGEVAELEAAPLKVGVKIPSVPELRKRTVDHAGQTRTAEDDETFRFLVYPGTALSGEYTTEEEWAAALGETPYEVFTVTVKKGESLSESVRMETAKWKWTDGEKYTIVELPCGEDYAFKRFVGSTGNSYTLTYTAAQTQIVTCENTALRWSIVLTKENVSHEAISGAVFALYSPSESDALASVPAEYADLNIALMVEQNGKTLYLKDVQTTPENGKLTWSNLLQEEYYLLEVKAPGGYYLSSPAGQLLKQQEETQGVYSLTVVNAAGYSLPMTGGAGTLPFTIGGLLLTAGSLLYGCKQRRKRERRSN